MKKQWKILALVLAVMLLCTACEEKRTIDISDGGDNLGSAAAKPVQTAQTGTKTDAEKPAEEPTEEPAEEHAEAPAETASQSGSAEKSAPVADPSGDVTMVKISMRANTKGMCLVPVSVGGAFVVNDVLAATCTITTDPKNFVAADCTVEAKNAGSVKLTFVLLQNDKEILSAETTASLNQGRNELQVLFRLTGSAIGEYVGRLYADGQFVGESSVTA